MFSRRTAWDRALNPLSERLERIRAEGRPIIDLTESNPTRCGLQYPVDSILRSLAHPRVLEYEPDPLGQPRAREALRTHLGLEGVHVEIDDLLFTSGTSEAFAFLFKVLCDPGDNVIAFAPSYPLFELLTAGESIELRSCALIEDAGWTIDFRALESVADKRTRAILVVSPGNPTGQYLKTWELERLGVLCAERGWALICDEVFSSYRHSDDPDLVRTAVARQPPCLCFSLGGLSKLALLPQLKLSWILAGGPIEQRREAMERLELVADAFLSVNMPVQLALAELLELSVELRTQVMERLALNRSTLKAARQLGGNWSAPPFEGGWNAVLKIPKKTSDEELCLRLLDAGVLAQPGYFYDFATEGRLVISLLPKPTDFATGLATLIELLR